MSAAVWTDERIREAFIYDGGEAEYHDPISGAQTQRQVAGDIFDAWLAAHDAALLATVSTPPADDVREAVMNVLACHRRKVTAPAFNRPVCSCGWASTTVDHGAYAFDGHLADAVAAEVRPRGTVTDAEEMPDTFSAALGELVVDSEGDGINHVRHTTLRDVLGQHILSDVAAEAWALTRQARP